MVILGIKYLKQLIDGSFLEHAHTQNLEDFVECGGGAEPFFEQRQQGIDAHRHPQLRAQGIGAGAIKYLDAQVLFEPAKEQFNLPALLVELGHRQRRQAKVIGQKHQRTLLLRVVEAHPPQFVGIVLGGVKCLQADDLVAAQSGGWVHWLGVEAATTQRLFGSHDELGTGLFDSIEASPVQVTAVH